MDELHHECGIAALAYLSEGDKSPVWGGGPDELSRLMPRMLMDLQNRGQLAAGMSTYRPDRDKLIDTYKRLGLVNEAFKMSRPAKYASVMEELAGRNAIGHVRYATCGADSVQLAQPFERKHGCKWKWFAFAFNGNIANYEQLRQQLLDSAHDYHLTLNNDTEVIMHYLAHEMRGDTRPDLVKVFTRLSQLFDGAFNIVFMNALGDVVVARDGLGLRPMCYGVEGNIFAAASESVPLQNLGFQNVKPLEPGKMIVISDGKLREETFAVSPRKAHCFFEWVYFANVASTLDNRSVYLTRSRLGQELARLERTNGLVDVNREDTIVVPVPDTGKAAADAMAFELGIPSVEGLIRNRYVGRTFIEGANRADKVKLKFTPLRQVLQGKKVLLVEDSIVRSTTLKVLVQYIRERGGAAEVHVRVACPPIISPCFYGIDMSTVRELFAPRHMVGRVPTLTEQQDMARELGADSLVYLPVDSLARCIDLPKEQLCRACVTGDYPTETGTQLMQLAVRQRDDATVGRTHEPTVV